MNDTDKNKFEKANCVFCNDAETMLLYCDEKLEGSNPCKNCSLNGCCYDTGCKFFAV